MTDLVSYNHKHNEANGERNQDGESHNLSWNCGVEGATTSPTIQFLREQQRRNFLATLFLSQGVPMIRSGDELGHTQRGNNNAYCQDNEINWLNWDLTDEQRRLFRFVCRLSHVWRDHPVLQRRHFFQGRQIRGANVKDILWLTPEGQEMTDADWHAGYVRCLGVRLDGEMLQEVDERGRQIVGKTLLLLLNAHHRELPFTLYATDEHSHWSLLLDTAFLEHRRMNEMGGKKYLLQARSMALFQLDRTWVGRAKQMWSRHASSNGHEPRPVSLVSELTEALRINRLWSNPQAQRDST
ncbi:MAG: hypothetical protein U0903_08060 [Planctomycetales bacterium]